MQGDPTPLTKIRGTILVVDDEDGPRQSLRAVFKDDFHVLTAADGHAALDLAKTNQIDVAVLDIRLGAMSGIEVLEKLKLVDPSIDVVMMTAFETTETMRQAMSLRACGYITKPFELHAMRSAVANAMLSRARHRASDQTETEIAEVSEIKIQDQISATRADIYASIIHDMNGPLTAISGFVQLMRERLSNPAEVSSADVAFVRERLGTVYRQVNNCVEISRRYLSFLRPRSDSPIPISANQVLNDLNQLLIVHPSLLHHRFTLLTLPQDLAVRINSTDLVQILLNLVVNALQCSPRPHLVQVTASAVAFPLDMASLKDGPHDRFLNLENFANAAPLLAVAVRDDGPGIPEELLPKIFQPYFTTKPQALGTGLGLSIVQRLVKEAKGALHVHTRPGEGTMFTVYLPASTMEV
jgi:signal transduction histidine kinase